MTQKGEPTNPVIRTATITRSKAVHTPRKLKKQAIQTPPVHNIPGKKIKNSNMKRKKVTGKCSECSVIWDSKTDILFRKENGKRQSAWIGCDIATCKYWAHVKCAGLILTPGKAIEKHKFLCKDHTK